MSEQNYSTKEINDVWTTLNSAKQELDQLQSSDSEKKKELVIRIRDSVRILIRTKSIPIKKNQTKLYVRNILEEKGVSYSDGHFSELFLNDEKRNYSKSSQGNIHEHEFKTIGKSKEHGEWQKCDCGTNRINGIIQTDTRPQEEDDEDQRQKTGKYTVREIIEPTGMTFDYLKLKKGELLECVKAIDLIFQKCTLDVTSIKKQTIENPRRQSPEHEYQKLYENTRMLREKRVNVVTDEFSHVDDSGIEEAKKSISQIMKACRKVNDRTKITSYEKGMAKMLIEKFDYLIGDIASILNVTTKHVKNNILKMNATSANDQDSIFEQLDFLARCPGCGLGIADHIDEQYQNYKNGKSLEDDPFDLNSFSLPPYAQQVIDLKQDLRQQKILVEELKKK